MSANVDSNTDDIQSNVASADAAAWTVPEDKLQALVFDCDGTLVDSMPVYWRSWVRICDEFGLKLDWDRFLALAGTPVKDIIQLLLSEKQDPHNFTVDQIYEKKKVYGAQVVEEFGTPAIEAVLEIVKNYHGKVPLAVASSGNKTHVMSSLECSDMTHFFDVIVTIEDVKNPKPAPDLFLEACRQLSVDPRFCRGFEDADLGMESLRRAGLEAIDVRLLEKYPHFNPNN